MLDKEAIIEKLALLKRNAMSAPFEQAFAEQATGKGGPVKPVPYREDECLYVQAQSDRVTAIFTIRFRDATDVVLGKVFLTVRGILAVVYVGYGHVVHK